MEKPDFSCGDVLKGILGHLKQNKKNDMLIYINIHTITVYIYIYTIYIYISIYIYNHIYIYVDHESSYLFVC